MNAEIKEKIAVGLDVAMGICYGLRRWVVPSNENTAKSMVNQTLEEEIEKIDAVFERVGRAKKEVKDFIQKPEVKIGFSILGEILKKVRKTGEGSEKKDGSL